MKVEATKREWVTIAVIGLMVICICYLAFQLFSTNRKLDVSKRIIAIQDSAIVREREIRNAYRDIYDSIAQKATKEAEASLVKARANQLYYDEVPTRLKNISDDVHTYNDDQLRRAFAEFQ